MFEYFSHNKVRVEVSDMLEILALKHYVQSHGHNRIDLVHCIVLHELNLNLLILRYLCSVFEREFSIRIRMVLLRNE